MTLLAALALAAFSPAALAAPSTPESASLAAERGFLAVPAVPSFRAAPQAPVGPLFEVLDCKPRELGPARPMGANVGSIALPTLLDRHRDLFNRTLGRKPYDISVAGDAGFKTYFLTFQQAGQLTIAPLGDINRLRGDGINVQVEPGVVYNFKVSINIFNPVRGSTLKITPVSGTQGPKHEIKTGAVLDAVKGKSYIFKSRGKEYWLLHGTDVDPATNRLTDTRSLLFIHEAGLSTKAWPLAESQLAPGKPLSVDFEGDRFVLTRSAAGELTISEL